MYTEIQKKNHIYYIQFFYTQVQAEMHGYNRNFYCHFMPSIFLCLAVLKSRWQMTFCQLPIAINIKKKKKKKIIILTK